MLNYQTNARNGAFGSFQSSYPIGSAHAELVALRVAQHDGTASHVIGLPGQAGACLHQLLDLLADQLLALLAADLVPGYPDVEMDAVLSHLALGYPLEVQARPFVRRIDHRRLVTELLFRQPDRPAEVLPGRMTLRRWLEHVVQSQRPELGQLPGLGGVEDDLDLRVHDHAPVAIGPAATVDETHAGPAAAAAPAGRSLVRQPQLIGRPRLTGPPPLTTLPGRPARSAPPSSPSPASPHVPALRPIRERHSPCRDTWYRRAPLACGACDTPDVNLRWPDALANNIDVPWVQLFSGDGW